MPQLLSERIWIWLFNRSFIMNEHLSSASLKTLAKGQLLGKYGTLVGAYAIHMACVLFATLCDLLFVDTTTLIGIIIYYAVSFIISLLSGLFVFGEAYIYLKLACNQQVTIGDLFYGFSNGSDKVLKVQAVLALISMILGIPNILVSYNQNALLTNPYLLLICVIVILIFAVADVVISLIFSQSFYLMLDFPGYSPMEVLRGSYKIMKGSKGRLFYIDLSFIPLFLLGLCTCGIGFLWILPYYQSTRANFYLDLMKKRNND